MKSHSLFKEVRIAPMFLDLKVELFIHLQKQFADKYESFTRLVAKVYPSENIPSGTEMRDLLASM